MDIPGDHPTLLLFGVEYSPEGAAMATAEPDRIEGQLAAILAAGMERRELIALLGSAAAAWPLAALGQDLHRRPLIAWPEPATAKVSWPRTRFREVTLAISQERLPLLVRAVHKYR